LKKKQKGGGGRKRKYFSFKEGQNIISKKKELVLARVNHLIGFNKPGI
jgi:hypothetical protein